MDQSPFWWRDFLFDTGFVYLAQTMQYQKNRTQAILAALIVCMVTTGRGHAQLLAGRYANNNSTGTFSATKLYDKKKWAAEWIWLDKKKFPQYQRTSTEWISTGSSEKPNYRALFRTSFPLQQLPAKAILFITADVHFQVYVNGSLAATGPVNIGSDYGDTTRPAYWYYSSFDVRKWLKKGPNLIAVEVNGWGMEISETTSSYGKLLCELDSETGVLVKSSGFWKAVADTSYSWWNGNRQFNAQKEPRGWNVAGFNDASWPAAVPLNNQYVPELYRNNLPALLHKKINPVTVNRSGNSWLLDYGKNMPAHISFSLDAAAGDTLSIIPFEKSARQPNRSIRFICRRGHNEYYSPYIAAFRFLEIKKPVTVSKLVVSTFFSTYPVPGKGSFHCSDSFYNQLWRTCRYTTQLCMSDMFFDSPLHQEPIGCTGDYFIESMNNYYAFGDPWLTRQNLLQTAQLLRKNDYRMFHTSYSLLWVQMLRQYGRYTGDTLLVRELLPDADRLMTRFITYLGTGSLVSNAPNYMFMDWINIKGFNAHHPPAMIGMGYLSALLYKAMQDIDAMRGQPVYTAVAGRIKTGINQLLWDSAIHLYRDGIPFTTKTPPGEWLPADTDLVTHSAQMNTMAVLYGIAPLAEQQRLMQWVTTQQEYELQPYFMSYVLGAVQKAGTVDQGLSLLERWRNGIDTSTKTLKENWRDKTDFGYGGDYSHAWGGSPLRFLSENILGISPGTGSYDTIHIHPYNGTRIAYANGMVPVGGTDVVRIAWRKSAGIYTLVYTIPAKRKAVFIYPDGRTTLLKPGKNSIELH